MAMQHQLSSSIGLLWCIVSVCAGLFAGYCVRFAGYKRDAPIVYVPGDDTRIATFCLFSQFLLIVVWWGANAFAYHEFQFKAGWWPLAWMVLGSYGLKLGYRIGVHKLLPPVTKIPEEE